MALKLVLHTFRMIFGNFGQALRISIGPYLIGIVIAVIALTLVGLPINGSFDPTTQAISPAAALLPLLILLLILFITAWVAVSWHRFILLEEYAGALPAVTGRPIWPYAGKSILLGLIMLAVAIPLLLILGPLLGSVASSSVVSVQVDANGLPQISMGGYLWSGLISAVLGTPIYFVVLRFGIALVGTALCVPLGFGEAWRATASINSVIFGVAVIMTLVNFVPSLLITALQSTLPLLSDLLNLVLTWVTMMLGISILTTIYGHVIEDRPLVS